MRSSLYPILNSLQGEGAGRDADQENNSNRRKKRTVNGCEPTVKVCVAIKLL